jgi:hypothetical protein
MISGWASLRHAADAADRAGVRIRAGAGDQMFGVARGALVLSQSRQGGADGRSA